MNLLKLTAFSTLSLFTTSLLFATDTLNSSDMPIPRTSTQQADLDTEAFIKSCCMYQYSANEEETPYFFPDDAKPLLHQFQQFGPIHVNLIDRQLGDGTLKKLFPYAQWIYGLSLEGNDFSTQELEHLSHFTNLRYLDLTNTLSLIDPSLKALHALPHLATLNLTYNRKLSEADIKDFKEKNPQVTIIR